jgi:hypothetical protein
MGWVKQNKYGIIISSVITLFLGLSIYNAYNPFITWDLEPEPEPTTPVEFQPEIKPTQTIIESEFPDEGEETSPTPIIDVQDPQPNTLLPLIEKLSVSEEHIETPYNLNRFEEWGKTDNKCTTEETILIRDAQKEPIVDVDCKIFEGEWYSPYDNTVHNNHEKVSVHHTVHFKETWESGAHAWDLRTRRAYVNDTTWIHTIKTASLDSVNSKADKTPDMWMPTNTNYTCEYLYAWVTVKTRWQLTVDETEKTFLTQATDECAFNGYTFPNEEIPSAEIVFTR